MGVYTFVCRKSISEWSAKLTSGGEIEASASSTYDLERKLVQATLSRDSGVVSSSFNMVTTPSSVVFQVSVGCGFVGAAATSASVSGVVAASVAPAAEEKKEEPEESDDDIDEMFTSIFD